MIEKFIISSNPTGASFQILHKALEAHAKKISDCTRTIYFPQNRNKQLCHSGFDVLYDITYTSNTKQLFDTLASVYTAVEDFNRIFPVDIIPVILASDANTFSSQTPVPSYRNLSTADIHKIFTQQASKSFAHSHLDTIYVDDIQSSFRMFDYVVVGGTFDHLHSGHKILLTASALFCSNTLKIGITSDSMASRKLYAELLEPFEARSDAVHKFVHKIRPSLKYEIHAIHDPLGGAHLSPHAKALVVTSETCVGGKKLNEIRESNGLTPLTLICTTLIKDQGLMREKISSTAIRKAMKKS